MPRCADGESVMPTTNYRDDSYWFMLSGTSHLQVESLFLLSSLIFHDFTYVKNRPPSHQWTVQWNEFFEICSREVGELVLETWTEWFGTKKKQNLERPLDFWKSQESQLSRNQIKHVHFTILGCLVFSGTFQVTFFKGPFWRCQFQKPIPRPRADPQKTTQQGKKAPASRRTLLISMSYHVHVSIP